MQIIYQKKIPTITENGIYGFFSEYRFLSNYHLVEIEIDNISYPSSEHAYMAQKTLDMEEKKYIASLSEPKEARLFGQSSRITLRADWEQVKLYSMAQVLRLKFQHPDLKLQLLATDNLYLEESNDWHDKYWGVHWNMQEQTKSGHNHLGQILMIVREEIKKSLRDSQTF